jgi:hypothetical protein
MKRGSPAEPFFGQRELNFSAGRRIGGRLSEIFPQLPPKPSRSPAAQKKKKQPPIPPGRRGPPLRGRSALACGAHLRQGARIVHESKNPAEAGPCHEDEYASELPTGSRSEP